MDSIHVIPVNDTREHIDEGLYCHCNPDVQKEYDTWIVVHNSYDGREWQEMLSKI